MDLLYEAAKEWEKLISTGYRFIYGRKRKLIEVKLEFETSEFYHVAGFPHLDDIAWPFRFSQKRMLSKVLDGTVSETFISKSKNYENIVKPKLRAITQLQSFLDGEFNSFLYNQKKVPFTSSIEAKFLLSNNDLEVVFLFTDEDKDGTYFTRSVFLKDNRDFTMNQTPITLLLKEKKNLATGAATILSNRMESKDLPEHNNKKLL